MGALICGGRWGWGVQSLLHRSRWWAGGRSGLAEDVVLGELRRIHQGATGLENLLFFSGFLWASLLHLICFTHGSLKDISLSLFQR